MAEVTAGVEIQPALSAFGLYSHYFDFYMYILAQVDYQVMVVPAPEKIAPADVKGVPVIGITEGRTEYSGNTAGEAQVGITVNGKEYAAAQTPLGGPPYDFPNFDKKATGTFRSEFLRAFNWLLHLLLRLAALPRSLSTAERLCRSSF